MGFIWITTKEETCETNDYYAKYLGADWRKNR